MSATDLEQRVDGDDRNGDVATSLRAVALRVSLGIAWREARRAAVNPLWLIGAALGWWWFLFETAGYPAVMHRDSVYVAKATLLLVPSAAVVFNLAALRPARHGVGEQLAVTAFAAPARLAGLVLASMVAPAYGSLLATALILLVDRRGGAGGVAVAEVVAGPLLCWLAALAGIAMSRLTSRVVATGLVLLGGLVAEVALMGDGTERRRWLAPFVDYSTRADAFELVWRPDRWHAVYLLGMVALVATLAVVRRVGPASAGAVLGSIALIAAAAAAQLAGPSDEEVSQARRFALERDRVQTCFTSRAIRACAYPAYAAWAKDWLSEADQVVTRAPGVPFGRLTIEQNPGRLPPGDYPPEVTLKVNRALERGSPNTIFEGMEGYYAPVFALDLRGRVAMWLVGLPPSRRVDPNAIRNPQAELRGQLPPLLPCSAPGQARTAVALWIAYGADPVAVAEVEAKARSAAIGNRGGVITTQDASWGGVMVGPEAAFLAVRLARSGKNVAAIIRTRWPEIVSGELSLDELAVLSGVDPPEAVPMAEPTGPLVADSPIPPCS